MNNEMYIPLARLDGNDDHDGPVRGRHRINVLETPSSECCQDKGYPEPATHNVVARARHGRAHRRVGSLMTIKHDLHQLVDEFDEYARKRLA